MAMKRSRRLHKKLHIEEFQEMVFSVVWRFSPKALPFYRLGHR